MRDDEVKKSLADNEGIERPSSKEPELTTAHILFMDIVGYSKLKSDQQVRAKDTLNHIVKECLPDERRLMLPAGDGMAIAFLKNPASPLLTACKIALKLKEAKIPLRMGMHTGPVYLVEDINQQRNIVGGGINLAQRVMDCGDAGHILASKQIAEQLSEVKEEYEKLFYYLGKYEVKHKVVIEIYNVYNADIGNPNPPKRTPKPGEILSLPLSLHNQTPPEPNFVGRKEMLETITNWYKDPNVRIGALIGWGGVGKSALLRKWYDSLCENNVQPDGIFWWGYYRNALLDSFLDSLLEYLAQDRIDLSEIKSTWQKTDKIKDYLQEGEYLIILDGLEQMQKGEESGDEFGCMAHRECTELLRFLADTKGKGLCLITTRYPLTDLKNYKGLSYKNIEIERLELEDARELFKKVGVKGDQDEIDAVVEEYGGHALSLTLLSGYLVQDFGGDIKKAKMIPPFYSDEEAGGKAHRILLWYAQQLDEAQQIFMKLFSLFRTVVSEREFEGVFRTKMETEVNKALIDMSEFSFKRMVDNLCDRRLIQKGSDNTYSTHPLIKGYFESIFNEQDKRLCHKRIYQFIGSYAPELPETLEEMKPLFEQVYHGCCAEFYYEVCNDVLAEKIDRREGFIVFKLGAWETALSLIKTFFPEGDLSQLPLVSKKSWQGWLLNNAGISLLSTGRPKEAEEPFKTSINLYIEYDQIAYASVGYQNLADLQFRTGRLEMGLDSAKKALELAEKASSDDDIITSKAYIAWILHLLGKNEEADDFFRQADELEKKIYDYGFCSLRGVQYADFLLSTQRTAEALELTQANLNICQRNNWINDISICHRVLSLIERTKGNYDEAETHLQKALEIAKKIGVPYLEIEVLLESSRLHLDLEQYESAIQNANDVLKICSRTGFILYEPDAELILARAHLARKEIDKARTFAQSAYKKATEMHYHSPKTEAEQLLSTLKNSK